MSYVETSSTSDARGIVPSGRETECSVQEIKSILRGDRGPSDLEETRAALAELARRKCGNLPPEILVEQVLQVTEGTDWPTRRAGMEALLRRWGFAERDDLRVIDCPPKGRMHGTYRLAGRRGQQEPSQRRAARPYATELVCLAPLRGSCDCADFLRGSLGLCKHLLVVVDYVLKSPRRVATAQAELAEPRQDRPVLRWNPVRSWRGEGDRLLGLTLGGVVPSASNAPRGRRARTGRAAGTDAQAWFRGGSPLASIDGDLARRQEFLAAIDRALRGGELEAEPAARALIGGELARVRRSLSAIEAAPKLLAQVKSIKRKLYPYQREGVRRFLEARHLLLADDMGLGKTTQAVAACHALFRAGEVRRGLLLVPASLKSQWIREWQATSDVPVQSVDGRPEERARLYKNTRSGFLVMNYEQLLRDLPAVHRYAPEIVVLDEAQRIKNWATKSSVYVKTLCPEWRLVLTGTPMENRLEELASILDWVDDVALTPKWRLVPWHTTFEGDGGRGRAGARNLDTLRARLAPCTVRRVRREVLKQLPPRTDTRVPVEMTEQQRFEHDELIRPIAELAHRAHRRPLTQAEFLKLMQMLTMQRIISNGLGQLRFDEVWPTLSRRAPDDSLLEAALTPKLFELRRLVEELAIQQNRKVVVFSQWRNMLRLGEWATRDVLGSAARRAVFFTGAESQQQRTRSVIDLHDDPDVSVMFLTDAGGVGLNLQRAASACINLELPWNPAVLEQRIGRIYRLGQEQPIDVYNLVTEYGIESRIALLVAGKKALFSGLFDGTSDEIRFDMAGGFLKDVERLVDPVEIPELGQDDLAEAADASADDEAFSDAGANGGALAGGFREPELALESRMDASNTPLLPAGAASLDSAATPFESASFVPASETAPSGPEEQLDGASASVVPGDVRGTGVGALLGRVHMSRTPEGALRLEAPPDAAEELIRLFEGMAALFRSSRGSERSP
jgi:hypothetical protein